MIFNHKSLTFPGYIYIFQEIMFSLEDVRRNAMQLNFSKVNVRKINVKIYLRYSLSSKFLEVYTLNAIIIKSFCHFKYFIL
jgi:hypothetical protein